MRKIFLFLLLILCVQSLKAQDNRPFEVTTNAIYNKDAKFLLFPTKNVNIFLKLNTRTGEVYMVQYSLKEDNRFQIKMNYSPLVDKNEQCNGRFMLYPTTNIYNFILLDQIDGRTWQVQWHFDQDKRLINRINGEAKVYFSRDSIKAKDIEKIDNLYYVGSELLSGFVSSNDSKTIEMFFNDGRFLGGIINHNNDECAIRIAYNSVGIEDEGNNDYYDENQEKLTLKEFKEKYPELFERAKKAYEDFPY